MSRLAAQIRPIVPASMTPTVQNLYRMMTGRGSRQRVEARMLRKAASKRPVTYNEKIRHKMAFDRRPLLTTLADKVAVRDYVAERIGPEFLSEVYACASDPTSINWSSMPRQFVAKVNHASGGMVLVWDGAEPGSRLPADPSTVAWDRLTVRPKSLEYNRLNALLAHWLKQDFSWFPGKGTIEWAYADVPPKVFVEELLEDDDGPARDLKFTMVDGQVIWIQVDSHRFSARGAQHTKDLMTPDWSRLPVEYFNVPNSAEPPAKPVHLQRLLNAAEALGAGLDFVRADFYELGDRIVFGEMTNYPACGNGRIDPPSFDEEWGRLWTCSYEEEGTGT